jgi:hypothetical protein
MFLEGSVTKIALAANGVRGAVVVAGTVGAAAVACTAGFVSDFGFVAWDCL